MNQLTSALKTAFGDCKNIHYKACANKTSYEEYNLEKLYVFDENNSKGPIQVVNKPPAQLTVLNSAKNIFCILKSDKCLFTNEQKKCDCVVFNSEKIFFIEIKESSTGTRKSKRKKAVEQLAATIETLRDKNIDLSGHQKKAIICFKSDDSRPTKASANSQRAVFLEVYGVDLDEGNEIEF